MIKNHVIKSLGIVFLLFASISHSFGEIKIDPTISKVDGTQQFVIVLKGAEGKDKVFMNNGTVSSYDFNPNNIDSYPTWRINRLRVNRGVNVAPLYYITIQNASTLKYFAFGNAGDNKMISESSYNTYFERDANGQYKHTIEEMINFTYEVFIDKDNKHFTLGYKQKDDQIGSTSIFAKGWPSSKMRLVLVSLK